MNLHRRVVTDISDAGFTFAKILVLLPMPIKYFTQKPFKTLNLKNTLPHN